LDWLNIEANARLGELISNMDDFHSSGRGTMKRKDIPVDKKISHYATIFEKYTYSTVQYRLTCMEKIENRVIIIK